MVLSPGPLKQELVVSKGFLSGTCDTLVLLSSKDSSVLDTVKYLTFNAFFSFKP